MASTLDSLSFPRKGEEMDKEEEIEEYPSSSKSLGSLPDVVLQHLIPFLTYTSRRSLSQVNNRFRGHYSALLNEGHSLSIKGQVSVGVGVEKQIESVSFLSEFYTIRVEMDVDLIVEWTLKVESGIRTVVHTHYDGGIRKETTESVLLSSRDYLERKLKWIFEKFRFRKIHLGVPGLVHLFDSYPHKVTDIGVSDEVEYLKLAERLQPRKLSLFPPNQLFLKRGTLNFKNFPQLEELRLYGIPLDLDQLIETKIVKVQADTLDSEIKLKHAKKMVQNWKSGLVPYKLIQIRCDPQLNPVHIPHESWSELEERSHEHCYDHVENTHKRIGTFIYSPKSFEFVSWDSIEGKESNSWFF